MLFGSFLLMAFGLSSYFQVCHSVICSIGQPVSLHREIDTVRLTNSIMPVRLLAPSRTRFSILPGAQGGRSGARTGRRARPGCPGAPRPRPLVPLPPAAGSGSRRIPPRSRRRGGYIFAGAFQPVRCLVLPGHSRQPFNYSASNDDHIRKIQF